MSQRNDSAVCLPCLRMTLVSRNLQFASHQNPLAIGSVVHHNLGNSLASFPLLCRSPIWKPPYLRRHSFPSHLSLFKSSHGYHTHCRLCFVGKKGGLWLPLLGLLRGGNTQGLLPQINCMLILRSENVLYSRSRLKGPRM